MSKAEFDFIRQAYIKVYGGIPLKSIFTTAGYALSQIVSLPLIKAV